MELRSGVTLLCGSWICLDGRSRQLGDIAMTWALETPGEVVYVAHECNPGNIDCRLRELAGNDRKLEEIRLVLEVTPWPKALGAILALIIERRPRLLVLDVLRLRNEVEHGCEREMAELADSLDADALATLRRIAGLALDAPRPWIRDYDAVRVLHQVAIEHEAAVLAVYHGSGQPPKGLAKAVGAVDYVGPEIKSSPVRLGGFISPFG